jgi:hypothetical protein
MDDRRRNMEEGNWRKMGRRTEDAGGKREERG